MKNYVCLIISVMILIFTSPVYTEELGCGPVTISGVIKSIEWNPKKSVKGIQGMSGTLDSDRVFLAHYKIILSDFELSNDFKKGFFCYQWAFPNEAREKKELLIKLNHEKDDGFLKEKYKIRIINYLESGDEGGIRTTFDDIQIINETNT